jgi:chitinase
MIEWKWTKGEPYERSRRPLNKEAQETYIVEEQDEKFSKQIEQSAYTTSLNHDENTWDIMNQSIYNQGFRQSNKREALDDKIASREMVQQIGFNPFLTNQTNYVDDIAIRDQFLKPVNTTEDRAKMSNENEG